jgi:hypothetical protein
VDRRRNGARFERLFLTVHARIGLRVQARMFSILRKALSGCCASDSLGSGVPGSFGLQVNVRFSSLPARA